LLPLGVAFCTTPFSSSKAPSWLKSSSPLAVWYDQVSLRKVICASETSPWVQKRNRLPWMCAGAWVVSSRPAAETRSHSACRSVIEAAFSVPVTVTALPFLITWPALVGNSTSM
jgi:hypothetical protein